MIEIEKKFLLSSEDEARLVEDADFSGEKIIEDRYYDTIRYDLTRKDWWLRSRDGRFELKVPLKSQRFDSATRQYHELEDERAVRDTLGLGLGEDLARDIETAGYKVFCQCITTRRKYVKDGLTVDLDTVRFADTNFTYTLAEIELTVEDEVDAQQAEDVILAFATKHNLTTDAVVLGKVVAFLKEVKPDHYHALQEAGVIA